MIFHPILDPPHHFFVMVFYNVMIFLKFSPAGHLKTIATTVVFLIIFPPAAPNIQQNNPIVSNFRMVIWNVFK